jgi:hypothetical protein
VKAGGSRTQEDRYLPSVQALGLDSSDGRALAPSSACNTLLRQGPTAMHLPWAVSYVMKFKTEDAAAQAYGRGLMALGMPPSETPTSASGSATGLGPNSYVVDVLTVTLTVWQKKRFYVVLLSGQMSGGNAAKGARSMDSRIPG